MKKPAPLFVDSFELCRWLLERLQDDPRVLPRAICQNAIDLLSDVTLALGGRGRQDAVERADERLVVLRVQIRLAGEVNLLQERQMLHALERADLLGRQLGGWLKSLGPV